MTQNKEQTMKVLGITGGVGAGKSTVLEHLRRQYGARVIQADQVAAMLQQPGTACYEDIVRMFGGGILHPDGRIDRAKLASLVFADEKLLAGLNHLVHPAVKAWIVEEIGREKKEGSTPFLVIEAALLLEDHYDEICDEIWYVYADPAVRGRRLAESRGYTQERIRQIMQNQLEDGEYRRKCNFIIDNSGDFVENTYEMIHRGLVEHGFL